MQQTYHFNRITMKSHSLLSHHWKSTTWMQQMNGLHFDSRAENKWRGENNIIMPITSNSPRVNKCVNLCTDFKYKVQRINCNWMQLCTMYMYNIIYTARCTQYIFARCSVQCAVFSVQYIDVLKSDNTRIPDILIRKPMHYAIQYVQCTSSSI